MPNVLTIRMKDGSTDNLSRGAAIHRIDELLCAAFNEPVHDVHWFRGWVDTIGFSLAMGDDWNKCREVWEECEELLPLIDWMEEHCEAGGHYERN